MNKLPAYLFCMFLLAACSQANNSEEQEDVVRDLIDVAEAREALRNIPDIPWDSQINKTHYQAKSTEAAKRKPLFGDLQIGRAHV